MKYYEIHAHISGRWGDPDARFVARPSGRRRSEWAVCGGLVELIERPTCVILRATRGNEDHDEQEWTVAGSVEPKRDAPVLADSYAMTAAESFLRRWRRL